MVNKPFEALTRLGQARRLHRMALQALEQYDVAVASLHLLGMFTNALFRVRTRQDESFVIRLCEPNWRTESDLRAEITWLEYLARATDIVTPHPIPARSGDRFIEVSLPGTPSRRVLLMTWIPGGLLGKHLTPANLEKMGILFARLHQAAGQFTPPAGFTTRKMDRYLAREEPEALFPGAAQADLSPHEQKVLGETHARVMDGFQRLYADPSGLRVIHNDLWHDNIKIDRGNLVPLDFEDTLWGYPVQDIAMALQDLMVTVNPEAFEPLQAAFRRGYERYLPWPEAYPNEIDLFRAGRMLWVANYVAHVQSQYLTEHISRLTPVWERFLETGLIRK